jgi:hypothetical protein
MPSKQCCIVRTILMISSFKHKWLKLMEVDEQHLSLRIIINEHTQST